MRRITFVTVALAAVAALGAGTLVVRAKGGGSEAGAAQAQRYHCPMHPTYTSNKPGDCPICGMNLVPIEDGDGDSATAEPDGGQDATSGVSGRAAVTISSERRQILGVRSEEVKKLRLDHRIRTVGRVTVDERRLRHVHTKYDGYVEHLYVDYTGKLVRRGERLLSIYSPELVATQQEYLLAHRAQARLAGSAVRSAAQGSIDLHEAARQRLLLWDIRPADIAKLEKAGQVTRTLDVHADIGGYVVQKTAYQGMRVTPADTLYDIADLSHLWVMADVYEYSLPSLALGTEGHIEIASMPGRNWKGAVTYISPMVEERTRTIKVRLEVDNAGGELKPDMYADVVLHVDLGHGLVVPDGAVINAGDRRLVFLDRGEGRFEPREVKLGIKVNGSGVQPNRPSGAAVQVVSGVAEGDRVVTSANFLLDSESSLKAALSGMSSPDKAAVAGPTGHDHGAYQH
jgi:Cu(I)/Ag(I) efflux system membrane fusion protein